MTRTPDYVPMQISNDARAMWERFGRQDAAEALRAAATEAGTLRAERNKLRAVNAELVAALETALPVLRDQHAALAPEIHGGICPDREAIFAVEAALAKARE